MVLCEMLANSVWRSEGNVTSDRISMDTSPLDFTTSRSLLRQTCCVAASAIFYVHSSSVCSVRFPGGVNAASQGMDILWWM